MKVIVFDIGGTLMEYIGMPHCWSNYYTKGIHEINIHYNCHFSEGTMKKAVGVLENFNPRIKYREKEYSSEFIFEKVLEALGKNIPVQDCIETFWRGLNLQVKIFDDTFPVLNHLRKKGNILATLTDLPSAMPDEIFKKDIAKLLEYFDLYMSSQVSGYRKPNCTGLKMIAKAFDVPINKLIFVGDEEKDRQTAINAGCLFSPIIRTEKDTKNLYDVLEISD